MRSSFVCAFVCACVLFIVLTRERERELICDTYFSEIKKRKNRENREGEKTKEALFSFVLAGKETKKVNSQKHHYRSIGLPEEEALTKAGFSLLRIKIKLLLFVTRKRWWCAF